MGGGRHQVIVQITELVITWLRRFDVSNFSSTFEFEPVEMVKALLVEGFVVHELKMNLVSSHTRPSVQSNEWRNENVCVCARAYQKARLTCVPTAFVGQPAIQWRN